MIVSNSRAVRLIRSIEMNDRIDARKIISDTVDDNNDLTSAIGPLRVTALQLAAWRGWIDILIELCKRGADINCTDKLGRSPLHYAAHQGHAEVTDWLVKRGANLDDPVEINSCTRNEYRGGENNDNHNIVIGKNLPLPECWGRAPLHQAVRNNHSEVVKILVNAGAKIDAKDQRGVTPLLLAGCNVDSNVSSELEKFTEIIDALVSAKVSTNIIHPDTGSSALHHAVILGSTLATKRLLEGGAFPLFQCSSTGSTALHIAAAAGSLDTLVVIVGTVDSSDIDIRDQVGRTALHRAAYQGHRKCVELLVNKGSNLAAETKTGVSVIDAIFDHVPRSLIVVTELLNSRIRYNGNTCSEKSTWITVDFGILAPQGQLQMAVVSVIIEASSSIEQLGILQHPLVETFLTFKWSKLRGFFFLLVLVHVLFVISLSVYAISLLRHQEDFRLTRHVLTLCSCILIIHNTIQVLMVPRYYLKQFETWSSLTSASISLVTSTLAGDHTDLILDESGNKSYKCPESSKLIFQSISIAILFSWIHMMLLVGRFPTFGYYTLMFSTVLKNILKVLLAFICLIVGFALSFSVLFHGNEHFRDSWRALIKTVVMMMGEYEYGDLFNDDEENAFSSYTNDGNSTTNIRERDFLRVTSRIVFLGFVVLASIVLMNLMIGLAVNDIQGLEKEGHLRRLVKQAEFVAHLERVTSHRIFRSRWLHSKLRILVDSRRIIETKIRISCIEKYPDQAQNIPAELLEALFAVASKNQEVNDATRRKIDDDSLRFALTNLEHLLRKLQSTERDEFRVNSNSTRSFVKRKVARRIMSTNI